MDYIFKNDDFEIRPYDIVKLSNGMVVMMSGPMTKTDGSNFEITDKIFVTTTPISSLVSLCYISDIVEVIEHCDTFEKQMDYHSKHMEQFLGNPLHINLCGDVF